MNEFEKRQQEIKELQAPPQLEARLRGALETKQAKKRRLPIVWSTVAAAMLLVAFTYNYSAFAFYGKKIFGYEGLMTETLQQLDEEGYGQAINQSITLEDGGVFTIEGIMSDTNRFHVFYEMDTGAYDELMMNGITGFLTESQNNSGVFNVETGHGIYSFDPVNAFAKKLQLAFTYQSKNYEIEFSFDANKAVPTTLKTSLNQKFDYDFGQMKFKKIIATNASTVITASLNKQTDRRVSPEFMGIKLLADGKEVTLSEAGSSSTWFGKYDVELLFDAIPVNTTKLELFLEEFNGYEKVEAEIELQQGTYDIGEKWIEIMDVAQSSGQTRITIASDYDVLFDEVSLQTAAGDMELITAADFNDRTEKWIRTLYFDTANVPQKLKIGGMYYMREYGDRILIELD